MASHQTSIARTFLDPLEERALRTKKDFGRLSLDFDATRLAPNFLESSNRIMANGLTVRLLTKV
jgi:hypothetical protein